MIRKNIFIASIAALILINGCGGSSSDSSDSNSKGPSAGSVKTIGSLSGSEDVAAYLQESSWNTITLDLEKFQYDRDTREKSYDMEMLFEKKKVTVLADCYYISANYRVKDTEITFSKVSPPRPALDLPSCREFANAESAVSNFLIYSYTVKTNKQSEVVFEGTDIETSVTLKR